MDDWEKKYEDERKRELTRLQKKYPDLSKLKRIGDPLRSNGGDMRYETYFIEERVTDDIVLVKTLNVNYLKEDGKWSEYTRCINVSKSQRFLCVNGPLSAQKVTGAEGKLAGYVAYNVASGRWGRRGRDDKIPKVVLVYLLAD